MFPHFLALGILWGFVYDVVTLLGKIFRLRVVVFFLDVIMMVLFALSFFSLLIGYNEGQIRILYLAVSVAGLVAYMFSIHKILVQVFEKITKVIKNSAKTLKKSKKS